MDKRLSGVDQFFVKILPQAEYGSHWNKEMILQAIKWGQFCQQIFHHMTSDSESSYGVLCNCKDAAEVNADTMTSPTSFERKSFSLSDKNLAAGSSICKCCKQRKQHLRSVDTTLKSKSMWQKKKVASAVFSLVKDSGYNFWQMEECVLLLMSKLLLNKELSLEQQQMVRETVEESFNEEERKGLWHVVDQVKSNKENLSVLMESVPQCSLAGTTERTLVHKELKAALEAAVRCGQLHPWLKHHLTSDRLLLNAPDCVNEKRSYSLQAPNFLYCLLLVVSAEEDVGLHVLNWLTLVHRDSNHDCHALLINQWLSLFQFRSKTSKFPTPVNGEQQFSKFQQPPGVLHPVHLSDKKNPYEFMDLSMLGSSSVEERCFCQAVSTLLVSLLAALFEVCAVGLQHCDNSSNPDPKWVLRGRNKGVGPTPHSVSFVIQVAGVSIPSLLSIDNLTHFIHSLGNCSTADSYSTGSLPQFQSILCGLKCQGSDELCEKHPIARYHNNIRSILRTAFTAYICSPQGSLWAHILQKSEAL